jgi:hypothetical protein
MLEVESICLPVLDCDNAMGIYNNVVEAEVAKGVDNVAEFVVEEGWLVAINGGRTSGGINGMERNGEIIPFSRGDVSVLAIRFGVLMDELRRRFSRGLERRDLAPGPMSPLTMGSRATELGIGVVVGGREV